MRVHIIRPILFLLAAALAASLVSFSCNTEKKSAEPPPPQKHSIDSKNDLIPYLDSLERRYERACIDYGIANWNSYSKEAPANLDSAKAEFAAIFRDSATRATVEDWRRRSSSLADKPLARRLELWHRVFLGGVVAADSQIRPLEASLQRLITDFHFTYGGKPVTRAEITNRLRQEKKQSIRHDLWAVPAQLSAAAADSLVHLVKLRNARARELGYPNFYSLVLNIQAIDEAWLLKTMAMLEEQTRPSFETTAEQTAEKLRAEEIGPWDFDYYFHEGAALPDRYFPADSESVFGTLHQFERGIGFPVDSLPIKERIFDIPYGGLSLGIDIPHDSRFLLNPTKGKSFYAAAFHEYGHSLKCVNVKVDYPILKGYEWIPGAQCAAYEEGVADMHAAFTDDSLWLADSMKIKPRSIQRYLDGASEPGIYRLRRLLKEFSLEYEMYKNPDQKLDSLERALTAKYLLVTLDSTEAPQYAASIWHVSYPCYYQNYIMAAMISAQLQEALTDKFGPEKTRNPAMAEWITSHLYVNGEREDWNERIRNATGKSLEPGAYLRTLGISQSRRLTHDEDE